MTNAMRRFLQKTVVDAYFSSSDRCEWQAARTIASKRPASLLDVGCGPGNERLTSAFSVKPALYCGVEAHPELAEKARQKGLTVSSFDLNGLWPYDNETFDAVHCTQVIEHVHNTRLFLHEMYRVTRPNGHVVLTSENLCSLLNLGAMALGYTPFSLMKTCGWYVGNPLGLHYQESFEEHDAIRLPPLHDPAFSGITGHIRVLSALQAQELLTKTGFVNVEVTTLGLMPLPSFCFRFLEPLMKRRGHWLLMHAQKGEL
jgi:SAM-dependent methyltransferase